jgi:hypothetical protein
VEGDCRGFFQGSYSYYHHQQQQQQRSRIRLNLLRLQNLFLVKFHVLTATGMNMVVFCIVAACSLADINDVSEELTASIIITLTEAVGFFKTLLMSTRLHGATTQKTTILTICCDHLFSCSTNFFLSVGRHSDVCTNERQTDCYFRYVRHVTAIVFKIEARSKTTSLLIIFASFNMSTNFNSGFIYLQDLGFSRRSSGR